MAETTLNTYFIFLDEIVTEAGQILTEGFYGEKKINEKAGFWDLVTDYDQKVEQILTSKINETYPTHKILAEESSAEKGTREVLTDDPTWIIDPIDGTSNFVHGVPLTCISVGLSIKQEIVVGIVYNPLSHQKYTAIKGQGAFLNGRKIHVSNQQGLEKCFASFELSLVRYVPYSEMFTKRYLAVTHKAMGVRLIGSAALTLCMVASGGLDVYFHEHLKSWDIAAGVLIIKEAGGYVCNLEGDKLNLNGGSILAAANEKIANETVNLIKENM